MFTSTYFSPQDIIAYAKTDICSFLDSIPSHQYIPRYFTRAKQEIEVSTSYKGFRPIRKLSTFVRKHLDWLEMKYPAHNVRVHQKGFLEMLDAWLLGFAASHYKAKGKIASRAHIIQFGHFIAQKTLGSNCGFTVLPKDTADVDMQGFPSFLLISRPLKTISVVLDTKRIGRSKKGDMSERRYQMCLLHEIAHVRLHSSWIIATQRTMRQKQVAVLPAHEADAWLYAHAIMGYLGGLRARITRLLREEDDQGIVAP